MYMQDNQRMTYHGVYPEVYYKVMPFVMMACDELDVNGYEMLSPEMIMETADRICDDVLRMYPDLAQQVQYDGMTYEAASAYDMLGSNVESQQFYRRRNIFRDLVTIILLNEFFGRHRRRRFFY
jgi:hypothetical protein